MSILGGILGAAGSLWASSASQSSAKSSMNAQREALQNRHQWEVADLKAAGLNPILSANSGAGSMSGAQATAENPANAAVSSASGIKQMKIMERQQRNQDMLAKTEADLNSARTAKENQEAMLVASQIDSGYYGRQSDYLGASADQARTNISYMEKQQEEIESRIQESRQRQQESQNRISAIQAEIRKVQDERKELRARAGSHAASAELSRANARLAGANKKLAEEQARLTKAKSVTESFEQTHKQLQIDIGAFALPKARNDAEYETSPVGKFLNRYAPRQFWKR